jgi:hypothetical protein
MNYFLANVDIRRCCDVQPDCRRMLVRVVMCYHLVNSRRASEKARRNFRLSQRDPFGISERRRRHHASA